MKNCKNTYYFVANISIFTFSVSYFLLKNMLN